MIEAFCGYTGLLNFLCSISIGIFVLRHAKKSTAARPFAFFSFAVAYWSLGYFVWTLTDSLHTALWWTKIMMIGSIFIPTTYFHFTINLLDQFKKYKKFLIYLYCFSIFLVPIDLFTDLFHATMEHRYWFRFWPVVGPLYHPFVINFLFTVAFGHYLCFKAIREARPDKKNQIKLVTWGTLIGFVTGCTNFFLIYNIPVPPVLNFLVSFYVVSTAYAIINYRLMDIQVFIRKTVIFGGLVMLAVVAVSSLLTGLQVFAGKAVGLWSTAGEPLFHLEVGMVLFNHVVAFILISLVLPVFSLLIYSKNAKSILNISFSLYLFSIAWWAFFSIFLITAREPESAMFWDRMCLSGAVFIPTAFLHFAVAFTQRQHHYKNFIKGCYAASFGFLLFLWSTRSFVASVGPKFGLHFFTVAGPIYTVFIAFFSICVLRALYHIWKIFSSASDPKIKKQALHLFICSLVGYAGGSSNYLFAYDIYVPVLAELCNYGVLIFSIWLGYIVFRYRFLNVYIFIKKTLVFGGLTFVVVTFAGSLLAWFQILLGNAVGVSKLLTFTNAVHSTALLYAAGAFAIVFFNVALVLLMLGKLRMNEVGKSYLLWTFFVSAFSLGYGITLAGFFDYGTTLIWNKFCQAMAMMIGPFFFALASAYTGEFERRKRVYLFYLIFGATNAVLFYSTKWYMVGLWSYGAIPYYPLAGPLYLVFFGFFIISNGHAFHILCNAFRHSSGLRRKQLKYFLIAALVGYVPALQLFIPAYGIAMPPYGIFLIFLYVIALGYVIHKYKFLDVPVLIKRTFVFTGLSVTAVALAGSLIAILQFLVGRAFGLPAFVILMTAVITTVLLYRPLEKWLLHLADRFLFRNRFNYHELLKVASKGMARIQSLDHLARLIVTFLTLRAGIRSCALYVRSEDSKRFLLKASRGMNAAVMLPLEDPLVMALMHGERPLLMSEIASPPPDAWARNDTRTSLRSSVPEKAEAIYEHANCYVGIELAVPSFLGRSGESSAAAKRPLLRSILLLGGKKSDEPFGASDITVFETLAQESAIAIENARLYDEALRRSTELEEINQKLNDASSKLIRSLAETDRARQELEENKALLVEMKRRENLERLAASIGHELNNPLSLFSLKRMEFEYVIEKLHSEISTLDGALSANEKANLCELLERKKKLMEKFTHFYKRMKAVSSTVNSLIKAEDEIGSVSLRIVLDYVLEEVRFVTYAESLAGTDIRLLISPDMPPLRGNAYALQAVFVNLFVNAYQAMEGVKERRMVITAEPEPDGNMVRIEFSDNGAGMTPEVLAKCFDYRFTTKGNSGTGIGLTVVKQTIERHGGTISAESEAGQGTKFILRLPTWQEENKKSHRARGFPVNLERKAA